MSVVNAEDDADAMNELAAFYGFSGVELYKLEERAFNLAAGDFDSDGRTDVLVVDNRASCLRFLKQLSKDEVKRQRGSRFVNDLESDWRFDIRQIPVDKQVAGLVVDDFNADGRIDIAYVGAPDRLVVRYQPEPGRTEWTERWSVRLPDLVPAAWMISSGDLNGDERPDIAVLGKTFTYLVFQSDDGTMKAPEQLINTSTQLSLLRASDIDGDGRADLCYQANNGSARGLCARLQTADGRLGPELVFDLQQPRAVTIHDVDQKPGEEILTIDNRSGRVVVSGIRRGTENENSKQLPSRLVQFGVGEASGSQGRALAIGDIDGDQLNDVVITDPATAQVLVYRQNGIDGLNAAEIFPGLLDATDVCVADVDGDGVKEVIQCSNKEAAIAVSRFDDGRLTFPQTVARPDEGFEVVSLQPMTTSSGSELAVCMKKGTGTRTEVKLRRFEISADTSWKEVGTTLDLDASAMGSRGARLMAIDVDQDGVDELLVVPNGAGNKGITLVRFGSGSGDLPVVSEALNLGHSSPGELFQGHGDLFVAREAFARRMSFDGTAWNVADQFNSGESRARIAGVAVLDLDGNVEPKVDRKQDVPEPADEIVLVDIGIHKLRVLKQVSGVYRPWKEVELGTFNFESTHVADLNGDGRDDLLLFGNQQFALLASGGLNVDLKEIATFESDRDDAYPADIIAGDINGDGQADLAVIDTSIDGIQLLNLNPESGLKAATHFRVFEEKRLVTDSESRGTEPREGLVVDVTSDGRHDLLLLCHDRLILYPQDSGEAAEADVETVETK
ncbi:MAG: VCBS repeat-containing protein [Planctomycetaceae bacterium]